MRILCSNRGIRLDEVYRFLLRKNEVLQWSMTIPHARFQ
jgi:hypothetical protein